MNLDIFNGNSCAKCDRSGKKLSLQGTVDSEILIIYGAPTQIQSKYESMFKGAAAATIKDFMDTIPQAKGYRNSEGLRPRNDAGYAALPAVLCGGGTLSTSEIGYCSSKIKKEIAKMPNLKYVIALGVDALLVAIGDVWTTSLGGIDKWAGYAIPIPQKGYTVFPMWDPVMVANKIRGDKKKKIPAMPIYGTIQKNRFDMIREYIIEAPELQSVDTSVIEVLTETADILEYLTSLDDTEVAIDYETTGLKPHNKGHRIVSVSFSNDDRTVSFLISNKRIRNAVKRVLVNPSIKLIVANMKYEQGWSMEILGIVPVGWHWDIMLAAHIKDTTPGTKSLKWQAMVRLGVGTYNDKIGKYLKAKGSNDINKIDLADKYELLYYGGMDTLTTYQIYKKQSQEFTKKDLRAYRLLHDGTLALAKVEANGMRVDMEQLKINQEKLTSLINEIEEFLGQHEIGKHWKAKYRDNTNYNSDDQLRYILYVYMKLPVTARTEKGAPAVSKDVLNAIDSDFVHKILERSGYMKVRDTFLHGLKKETDERGRLHPSFGLTKTRTYRSSSSNPNFQNMPIRNKVLSKYIRGVLYPSKGHRLMEVDFSGVEVRIAAAYHKDPTMLNYINGGGDMHYDVAKQCFMLTDEEMTGTIRKITKGGFVFAEFYGDYYANCARGLLAAVDEGGLTTAGGMPLREHLKSKGINGIDDYIEHIKAVEDDFWNNRFTVYRDWKKSLVKKYLKKGTMTGHTGFTYRGVIDNRGIINYPVQGSAFHVLLQCLVWAQSEFEKRGLKSGIMGQIHDSMVIDLCPEETAEVTQLLAEIMTKKIVKEWKFINTPLDVEFEVTGIDESWHDKKEVPYDELIK